MRTTLLHHSHGTRAARRHAEASAYIWFSRLDMTCPPDDLRRTGNPLTDARYSEWHSYDNVPFPKHIEINRPRDEYAWCSTS